MSNNDYRPVEWSIHLVSFWRASWNDVMRCTAVLDNRYRIAVMLLLVTIPPANADVEADRAAIDQLLRDGRYEHAAMFCREQIMNSSNRVVDQATYTAELVRVLAEQARRASLSEARTIWNEASEAADQFARQHPRHPHTLLVTFQAAVAATVRVETEARTVAHSSESRQEALGRMRKALRRWKAIERELESRLRTSGNGRGTPQTALTVNTLRSVRDRVRHGTAQILLFRAVMYPPQSDDRLLACRQAIEQLEKIAPNNVGDIWWKTRIDFVRALRLRGDLRTSVAEADRLLKGPQLPRCIAQGLQAELLRSAVDAKDWNQVARRLVSRPMADSEDVKQECPEWALAELEALLSLASAGVSNTQEAEDDWNQRARARLAAIGVRHGPYWQRIAEATIARAIPTWDSRDAGLLSDLATARLRQGDIKGAIDALENAAEAAMAQELRQQAWQFRFEAAELCFQSGDFRNALIRFGQLAHSADAPTVENGEDPAAAAQMMAIKASAQALRHKNATLESYRSHLRRFLSQWPDAADADQVRFWLGRLYWAERNYRPALEQFANISLDFEHATAVVDAIGECCRALHLQAAATETDHRALEAGRQWITRAANAAGAHSQISESQELPTAARIWLSRLRLLGAYPHDRGTSIAISADLPGSATSDSPKLQSAAEGIQWVVRAKQGEFASAQQAIATFASSDANLWDDLIRALDWHSPAEATSELAELMIKAIERARAQVTERSMPCELRWGLAEAKARLWLGQYRQASETMATLQAAHAENAEVQELHALALSAGNSAEKTQALALWRQLVQREPKGSARWYRSKYHLAKTHYELGNAAAAAKTIALTRALYPHLGGPKLREKFDQLEAALAQQNPKPK